MTSIAASRQNLAEKCQHAAIELLGPLQRGEVAHTGQIDIPPVAAVAEAAVQQDHRPAGAVRCVSDPSAVVFDVALITCDRQRRGPVRFKLAKAVVANFHAC
jgi:hypothetical protein